MNKRKLRIVFLGTPDFAVESLKTLVEAGKNVSAVVTAPDKPAGRGQKLQESPVKKYAKSKTIDILQPSNLKDEAFLKKLRSYSADLQIVVAFRMLPEKVWNMPEQGTINLHASLLPQYRGAAPINHAIMNGERTTGVTTFFLQHQIDTGKIIDQQSIEIFDDETAGNLHDRLMYEGARLLLKTVNDIEKGEYSETDQSELLQNGEQLKIAPKIFKEDSRIKWLWNIDRIYNHIRGLSPYPASWTEITDSEQKTFQIKIFQSEKEIRNHDYPVGLVITDDKSFLKIAVSEGFIGIINLQQAGKKRMQIKDFLRGLKYTGHLHAN